MAQQEKYNRKYDPETWKTSGPNKRRKLDNIRFSLNEDDYQDPEDYQWMEMIASIISHAIEDLARFGTDTEQYKSAHKFIFSEDVELWIVAFGYNVDADFIRRQARKVMTDPEYRESFLSWCAIKMKKEGKIRKKENPAE
jgi:hypothetical protein